MFAVLTPVLRGSQGPAGPEGTHYFRGAGLTPVGLAGAGGLGSLSAASGQRQTGRGGVCGACPPGRRSDSLRFNSPTPLARSTAFPPTLPTRSQSGSEMRSGVTQAHPTRFEVDGERTDQPASSWRMDTSPVVKPSRPCPVEQTTQPPHLPGQPFLTPDCPRPDLRGTRPRAFPGLLLPPTLHGAGFSQGCQAHPKNVSDSGSSNST